MDTPKETDCWAVVELLGHLKLAGRLTEVERFGAKMGRLDVPDGDGFITKLFGGSSVYCVTVVSEEVARHVSRQTAPAPVSPWEFPKPDKQLAAAPARTDFDPDDDDDDDDTDDFDSQPEF